MKILLLLLCLFVISPVIVHAQSDYKVVFDVTSKDTTIHETVIRQLTLIRGVNPEAKLEVVIYGQGLDIVLKNKKQAMVVQQLITEKDISFKVCAMTLDRNKIGKDQLITGVEIVPDGIYEIISKQQQGWGYIKVAH